MATVFGAVFALGPLAHHGCYSLSHVEMERLVHLIGRDVFSTIASHPRLKSGKTKFHSVVLIVGNTTISVLRKWVMYYAWDKLWNIVEVESVNQPEAKFRHIYMHIPSNVLHRLSSRHKLCQYVSHQERL